MKRIPLLTLGLAAVAIAIHFIPGAAGTLQFDRAAALREPWRVCTAHFTHFDTNHLVWDLGVWLVLGAMCERVSRVRFASIVAAASVAIGGAVWWWQPQFQTYRGLSGLDFALFGILAGALVENPQRNARLMGGLALCLALAKCAFELATASTLFANGTGYVPVPLAHLVGLLIGAAPALRGILANENATSARSPIRFFRRGPSTR